MSKQIIMETLAKFQRGKTTSFDVSLGGVALKAQESTTLIGVMTMISVVRHRIGELATTDSTSIVLKLKQFSLSIRRHAPKMMPLILSAALPKFWIGGVFKILTLSVNCFLSFAALLSPHSGVFDSVVSDRRIGVIRSKSFGSLRSGAIFSSGNTPFLALFFGDWLARSSTWFRLFHGHDNTMTTREIGVIL
jgi:hypothetical protein